MRLLLLDGGSVMLVHITPHILLLALPPWPHDLTSFQKLFLDVLPQVAGGAARFSFQQLCRAVLGPADYQALAGRFHTVFITGIPALSLAVRHIPNMQRLHIQHCAACQDSICSTRSTA